MFLHYPDTEFDPSDLICESDIFLIASNPEMFTKWAYNINSFGDAINNTASILNEWIHIMKRATMNENAAEFKSDRKD